MNADNKHDQEGAGEEDEETVHSVKLKSYVLREEGDKKTWVEMGYGVLRLKKHKEKGARRVLLRSSSTGQILIVSPHSLEQPKLCEHDCSTEFHVSFSFQTCSES